MYALRRTHVRSAQSKTDYTYDRRQPSQASTQEARTTPIIHSRPPARYVYADMPLEVSTIIILAVVHRTQLVSNAKV